MLGRESPWKLGDTATLLGCLAVLAAASVSCWDYVSDDAYISFRYAANLLAGDGLTFNPGERVEGYTNFLWVLTSAMLLGLGGPDNLLWLSKVVGVVAAAATVAVTYLTGRRIFDSPLAAAAAALLLAASPALAFNAVSGLETTLFALWLALALFLRVTSDRRADLAFAGVMALASLTRPEGFYLFAVLLPIHWVAGLSWPHFRIQAVRMGALYTALVAPYLLWKIAYYGSLLPNTYYAKPGGLVEGFVYTRDFIVAGGFVQLGAFALLAVAFGLAFAPRARVWLVGFFAAQVSAVLISGGDWMLGWRFWVPCLPVLCLAMGAALDRLFSLIALRNRGVAFVASTAALLALVYSLSLPRESLVSASLARGEGQRNAHGFIAQWLAERARPGESVALMDIGMVGFHTPLRVVDITGLTDSFIGHSPGKLLEKRYDPRYVLDQQPEYLVLVGENTLGPNDAPMSLIGPDWDFVREALWFQDRRIASLPGFTDEYEHLFTRIAGFEGYLHLFRRRELARER